MPRRTKQVGTVVPPALPRSAEMTHCATLDATDGIELSQGIVQDLDLSQLSGKNGLFERSRLHNVQFNGSHLNQFQCIDVRFDACEWLNADWEQFHAQRVAFYTSRLAGIRLVGARLEDVSFQGCQLNYAVFSSARLKNVYFEDCRIVDASFEGATLEQVVFRNCDLSGSQFIDVIQKGCDVRGSILTKIQVSPHMLRGCLIEPHQALELVQLLGVVVQPLTQEDALE